MVIFMSEDQRDEFIEFVEKVTNKWLFKDRNICCRIEVGIRMGSWRILIYTKIIQNRIYCIFQVRLPIFRPSEKSSWKSSAFVPLSLENVLSTASYPIFYKNSHENLSSFPMLDLPHEASSLLCSVWTHSSLSRSLHHQTPLSYLILLDASNSKI